MVYLLNQTLNFCSWGFCLSLSSPQFTHEEYDKYIAIKIITIEKGQTFKVTVL